ncbi:unnamed protein product [Heligmosomoides polygyrus]|uniref:Uncharacterized protein n=1 Tax=Heligmosomoides polygyrus TaxID=6339 RepID=A0A183G157_HELPZ|nr:unnamed protein product [Heligmosomoides polygyrus]
MEGLVGLDEKSEPGTCPKSEEETEEAADAVAELHRPVSPVGSDSTKGTRPPSQEDLGRPEELFPPIVVDVEPSHHAPASEPIAIRPASARSSLRGSLETPPLKAERLRLSPSPRDRHLSLDRLVKSRDSSQNPPIRCPGDARISPRLSPSPLHFPEAVTTPPKRPIDEPIHTESNPFKQTRSELSSRRSDDSMLSLPISATSATTAPIVAAESVDDLEAEVSILNGNIRDDGSGFPGQANQAFNPAGVGEMLPDVFGNC